MRPGGLSAVMKRLDEMGLVDPTAATVNGIWADRIKEAHINDEDVIRTRENAYSQTADLLFCTAISLRTVLL